MIESKNKVPGEPSDFDDNTKVTEDFIIYAIPDELVVVLQTAVLLKVELDVDRQYVFDRVPRIKMPDDSDEEDEEVITRMNDTSSTTKNLLCSTHLGKLVDILDKQRDTAPMKTLLQVRPPNDLDKSEGSSSVSSR